MDVRPYTEEDHDVVLALTIETFRPFFEESMPSVLGERVVELQHDRWRDDYREHVPTMHDPDANKFVAVAEHDGEVIGYVGWLLHADPRVGEIEILAVDAAQRRHQVASALCAHAFDGMKRRGVEVVELGTGGDWFHAPARAFYEGLGMTPFPTVRYYKEL